MTRFICFCVAVCLGGTLLTANAGASDELHLYKVTTLRADLGELAGLMDDLKALEAEGYYEKAGDRPPLLMRHSQGDHWDLLLLQYAESYEAYFSGQRIRTRAEAGERFADRLAAVKKRLAFREDLFAYGPEPALLDEVSDGSGFYHIEMFHAAPGLKSKLVEQRHMENGYLEATGRRGNLVFAGDMGSDVDVFTIGFYRDLQHFAEPAPVSAEEREKAAVKAGFKSASDVGLYLRTLMSAHHDTLAVAVD